MMLLSGGIIEDYLLPYLNNKWLSMHREASQYPDRRFPFVIEEAVLNTALTGSIFRYMHDNNDYASTLVSEAQVKRYGTDKGRCDIIWYSSDTVYYVELKGVFLYDTAEANINALLEYVDRAVEQVHSIISESIKNNTLTINEKWYGFAPKYRCGFVGGLLLSDINNSNCSFSKYLDIISNNSLCVRQGIQLKCFERQFAGSPLNASYYEGEQLKKFESDGYFFLCAEFEIQ